MDEPLLTDGGLKASLMQKQESAELDRPMQAQNDFMAIEKRGNASSGSNPSNMPPMPLDQAMHKASLKNIDTVQN